LARRVRPRLLQLDDCALCFELLFDFFGFGLGHAFLYRTGRAFHEVLGFLETQAGDRADLLDHLNLLLAAGLEDDRELGLLLDRRRRRTAASGGGSGRRRRRRNRDAELVLELLDEL